MIEGSRLSDGVVTLAPCEAADVRTVVEWDADREIQHWFDWPLMADDAATYAARLASAERTIAKSRDQWARDERFAFVIQASGEGMGWIDLRPLGSGRGNVSYGIVERHRGRGAATRAVRLATQWAFDVLGWVRAEIVMIADNAASAAVARKAGFRDEAVLRSYGVFERYAPELGRRFDWAIYARLRGD